MPTYQYACTECGHEFDTVQSFADASLTECPQCTGKLRKVFNAVGIVFKGSGFYRTDSRTSASTGSGSGESGDQVAATKDAGAKESSTSSSSKDSSSSPSTSSTSASSGGTPSGSSSSGSPSSSPSTKGSAA